MEAFGSHERAFTPEEKEHIIKMMKFDHKVPAKMKHQVWMAHNEAQYFSKAGNIAALVLGGLTFYMPMVRKLNIGLRVASAMVPAYYMHSWGESTKEQLLWNKAYIVYQRFVVYHGRHPKIFE